MQSRRIIIIIIITIIIIIIIIIIIMKECKLKNRVMKNWREKHNNYCYRNHLNMLFLNNLRKMKI